MLKLLVASLLCTLSGLAQEQPKSVLWSKPADIASQNLASAIGEKAAPEGAMHFVKEDRHGTSPKFDVRDDAGHTYKAKLGVEARSETAATRLLGAVGYFTDADSYVPDLEVQNLPHLHRGAQFEKGDHVTGVRLKLKPKGEKNEGTWRWKENPFTGTRELNGLRVMMCLLNNWDLKDENNAVRLDKHTGENIYLVSDMGATFGRAGRSWTSNMSKDDPEDYRRAKFITKKTDSYVDFNIAQHPPLLYILNIVKPWRYWQFSSLRWIGKHIPRDDVRWTASLLKQLTDQQLHDAFSSAGYNQQETESLMSTLKSRIDALAAL